MQNFIFIRLNQVDNIIDGVCDWVITDGNGKILDCSKSSEKISNFYHDKSRVILLIPDSLVSYHLTHLPIKEARKRQQAVGFVLEEKILSNIENTLFNIGPEVSKDNYLVAVIDKEKLEEILSGLKDRYNIVPNRVLTDALCLYGQSNKTSTMQLYLNQDNNTSILIRDNIIVSQINNLDLIFDQINENFSVDLYKHNLNNIFDCLSSNKKKINIQTEQEISEWLPFLVKSWFLNKSYNKLDLSSTLIKRRAIDLKFNRYWKYTAILWLIIIVFYVLYKYLDYNIFASKEVELDSFIKTTLSSVDIRTSNLRDAEQLITRQVTNFEDKIKQQRRINEFFILLSTFCENFSQIFKINSMVFNDHVLVINFDINKSDSHYLDSIKKDFAAHDISLQEKSIDKSDNINLIWDVRLL